VAELDNEKTGGKVTYDNSRITVFWVVTPCSLLKTTDVSEVLTASIIKAIM
jgi:hypothetical protein